MRRPSLVFVTAFPPSRHTAGENFTRYLLLDLASVYSILVYYFPFDGHEVAPEIASCESITLVKVPLTRMGKVQNILRHPFTHPLFSGRLVTKRFARRILKVESGVPILYNFSQVFELSRYYSQNPTLFLCHDVISQKVSRNGGWLHGMELAIARSTERRNLSRGSSGVLTLSKKDADLIHQDYGVAAAALSIYLGEEIRELNYETLTASSEVCMFGAWSRPENLEGLKWSIANLLPSIVKHTRVRIIGLIKDTEVLQDLARLKNVVVAGFVENPYPVIAASSCLLAPLFRGAGIKLKVVESLACGTPVITSEVGFEGIDFPTESLSRICYTADEYVEATLKTLSATLTHKKELRSWYLERYRVRNLDVIAGILPNG